MSLRVRLFGSKPVVSISPKYVFLYISLYLPITLNSFSRSFLGLRRKQMPRGGVSFGSELYGQISVVYVGSQNALANFGRRMLVVGIQTAWAKLYWSTRRSACFLHRQQHHKNWPYRKLFFRVFLFVNVSVFKKRLFCLVLSSNFSSLLLTVHWEIIVLKTVSCVV